MATPEQINRLLSMFGPAALRFAQQYGVDPAFLLGMAASETNWGAASGYNVGGIIGAGTAGSKQFVSQGSDAPGSTGTFAQYNNAEEGYQAFFDLITQGRYAGAWSNFQKTSDSAQLYRDLQKAGYTPATDWPGLVASIAEQTRPAIDGASATSAAAPAQGWWSSGQTAGLGPGHPLDSGGSYLDPSTGKVVTLADDLNKGVDLDVPAGMPITSTVAGTVRVASDDGSGWGTRVEIVDAQGNVHSYGHLAGVSVKPGDVVQAGQVISPGVFDGRAGSSTGRHLSYDVHRGDGVFIDPTPYLQAVAAGQTAPGLESAATIAAGEGVALGTEGAAAPAGGSPLQAILDKMLSGFGLTAVEAGELAQLTQGAGVQIPAGASTEGLPEGYYWDPATGMPTQAQSLASFTPSQIGDMIRSGEITGEQGAILHGYLHGSGLSPARLQLEQDQLRAITPEVTTDDKQGYTATQWKDIVAKDPSRTDEAVAAIKAMYPENKYTQERIDLEVQNFLAAVKTSDPLASLAQEKQRLEAQGFRVYQNNDGTLKYYDAEGREFNVGIRNGEVVQQSGGVNPYARAEAIKSGAAPNPLGEGTSFAGAQGTDSYSPFKALLASSGLADEYWQAMTTRTPSSSELAAAFGSVDSSTGLFHSGTIPDLRLNTGLMQDLNAIQRYGLQADEGSQENLLSLQQLFKDAAAKTGNPYVDPFAGAFGPYKTGPELSGAFKVMAPGAQELYAQEAADSVNGDISGFSFDESGKLTSVPGFDTSKDSSGEELAAEALATRKALSVNDPETLARTMAWSLDKARGQGYGIAPGARGWTVTLPDGSVAGIYGTEEEARDALARLSYRTAQSGIEKNEQQYRKAAYTPIRMSAAQARSTNSLGNPPAYKPLQLASRAPATPAGVAAQSAGPAYKPIGFAQPPVQEQQVLQPKRRVIDPAKALGMMAA